VASPTPSGPAAAGPSWPEGRSLHGGADQIPLPLGPGQLWLCGKHFVGPDPRGAMASVGADRVVCLCQRHELVDRYPGYVEWLGSDASAIWTPVPDLHAPELSELVRLVETLGRLIREGSSVLLHCGAGIGRAGTVAAAVLMSMGASRAEALAVVAAHRPMAGPEAGAQAERLAELEKMDAPGAGRSWA